MACVFAPRRGRSRPTDIIEKALTGPTPTVCHGGETLAVQISHLVSSLCLSLFLITLTAAAVVVIGRLLREWVVWGCTLESQETDIQQTDVVISHIQCLSQTNSKLPSCLQPPKCANNAICINAGQPTAPARSNPALYLRLAGQNTDSIVLLLLDGKLPSRQQTQCRANHASGTSRKTTSAK